MSRAPVEDHVGIAVVATVDGVTEGVDGWPIYSGLIALTVGAAVRSESLVVAVATVALTGWFSLKARWEEDKLRATYPGYAGSAEPHPPIRPLLARRLIASCPPATWTRARGPASPASASSTSTNRPTSTTRSAPDHPSRTVEGSVSAAPVRSAITPRSWATPPLR